VTDKKPEGFRVRIERLERRMDAMDKWQTDMLVAWDHLNGLVGWLRNRVASFHPERHHCPKCRAVIHREAKSCGACGASWDRPVDPNAGLPS